jgi:hypothetical protein
MDTEIRPDRRGVGRKKKPVGRRRVLCTFSLRPEIVRVLDERIESGDRSEFINSIIAERLGVAQNNY